MLKAEARRGVLTDRGRRGGTPEPHAAGATRLYRRWHGGRSVTRFVFFFSSRRRHTRFDCDWSSDVCSSDLELDPVVTGPAERVDPRIDDEQRRGEGEVGERPEAGSVRRVDGHLVRELLGVLRSEERRVGKEGRSRWSAYH